jgi:hypothetical protein
MAEELTGEVDDALKSAKKVLDAAATARLLEGVKTVADGNGFSTIKDLGEVASAVASSMKNTGELQASLIGQMAELAKKEAGSDDSELKNMMNRILMTKMIEALGQNQNRGISPEMEKFLELLKEENQRLREELKEIKESRQQSPVEEQFQALMMQVFSQRMSDVLNPLQAYREIAKMKEEMGDLLVADRVPPEYSESGLRAKAIEKEIEALRVEENIRLRELEQKERMLSQQIPTIIAQAGTTIASALGIAPVRPLQFDGEAAAEAQRMAEGN